VLRGQATVFLSCSEKFKERVALPIRQALRDRGVFGVIVSEEPLLPRTSGDPDSKVESYLDASDAFVALCTPDDMLQDGTAQSRQNIIDEHQRARQKPHLRERIQVFKEPSVRLPSNINPTYDRLDVNDVSPVTELILRQLDSWGVLAAEARPALAVTVEQPNVVSELTGGLGLGDHEEAERRVYELLAKQDRPAQVAAVARLRQFLRESDDNEHILLAASVLEAVNRLGRVS
jgi:Predicted nucleotide-binding protein containing TIR-like domain